MATITGTATRVTVWNNFKTFLDGISYSTSSAPFITAAWNDKNPTYPTIVLHSANIPKMKADLKGQNEDRTGCTISIEVHAVGGKDLNILIDDIDENLVSDTTLETEGIQFDEGFWNEADAGQYLQNRQKIHMKVITLNFELQNVS